MNFQYAKLKKKDESILHSFFVYLKLKGFTIDYCVMAESNMKELYDTVIIQKEQKNSPTIALFFDNSKEFKVKFNQNKRKSFSISQLKNICDELHQKLQGEQYE